MKILNYLLIGTAAFSTPAWSAIIVDTETGTNSSGVFSFATLDPISGSDLAEGLSFSLLAGLQNNNGSLANLTDGIGQVDNDEPADSFFARDGNDVRVRVDLGGVFRIDEINSYSLHNGSRTPQNYIVYGATADASPDFVAAGFQDGVALSGLGFTQIASVSTGGGGNPVGVNISDNVGSIGNYQYLLFDMDQATGNFGTFFGEIDVIGGPVTPIPEPTTSLLFGFAGLALGLRRRR